MFEESMSSQSYDLSRVKLHGKPLGDSPTDLFIPANALEIYFEIFEGPLDVLLYLIRRQKFDVQDLPLVLITNQYLEYIQFLQKLHIDLAADYLVMAATLVEMKSRLLLPTEKQPFDDDVASQEALIQTLLSYEQLKNQAVLLDEHPRLERDYFVANADIAHSNEMMTQPHVNLRELQRVLSALMKKVETVQPLSLHVEVEAVSVEERMKQIMRRLHRKSPQPLEQLVELSEGRSGVVINFLALLELVKIKQLYWIESSDLKTVYFSLVTKNLSDIAR